MSILVKTFALAMPLALLALPAAAHVTGDPHVAHAADTALSLKILFAVFGVLSLSQLFRERPRARSTSRS